MDETFILLGLVSSKLHSPDLKKTILSTVSTLRSPKLLDGSRQLLSASSLCISALSHLAKKDNNDEEILSEIIRQILNMLRLLPGAPLSGNCDFHHLLPPGECIAFLITATLSEVAYFSPKLRPSIISGLTNYFKSLVAALGPVLVAPLAQNGNDPGSENGAKITQVLMSAMPQFFGFIRAFGRVIISHDGNSGPLLSYLSEVMSSSKVSWNRRLYDEIGSTLTAAANNALTATLVTLPIADFVSILKPLCNLLSIIPVVAISEHLSDMIAAKRISRRRFVYSTTVIESFRFNILTAIKELLPLFESSISNASSDSSESLKQMATSITSLANDLLDQQQLGGNSSIARSPHARTLHIASSAACVSIIAGLATNANEAESIIRRLNSQLTARDAAVTTASVISHRELYTVCIDAIADLAIRFPGIVDAASSVLQQFITEPAPLLLRLARHVAGAQTSDSQPGTRSNSTDPAATLTPIPSGNVIVALNDYGGSTSAVHGTAGEVLHNLRQHVISGLVKCQSLSPSDNDSVSNSVLRALPKRLYVVESYKSGIARDFVSQSILMAVGHLATATDAPSWSHDFALNVLQQRLARPPSPILDVLIVRQLGQIYASTNTRPESAATIMDIFTRILTAAYQTSNDSSGSAQYRHLVTDTVNTLSAVAEQLKTQGQGGARRLSDLFLRLLRSFVSLGLEAKRKRDQGTLVSTSSIAVGLGQLLPAIAQAADVLPVMMEQQKLFRDVWLFVITSGLAIDAPQPLWFPQWAESVRILAEKSPYLVAPNDAALTRLLLSTCALGEDAATPAELSEYRQSLVSLSMPATTSSPSGSVVGAPIQSGQSGQIAKGATMGSPGPSSAAANTTLAADTAAMVSRLSFAHCTYLLSVYKIEKYRAERRCQSGNQTLTPAGIDGIFTYLEDRVLQREKSGVYSALVAIADSVFSSLLVAIAEQPREAAREQLLDRLTQLLLVKFNHPNRIIRRTADSFLTRLVARFSHVLWSRTVLGTVLDILQVLSDAMMKEPLGQTVELAVPDAPGYTIQLPDNPSARESLLTDFGLRAADIFREAMRWAPSTTRSHSIHYLLKSGDMGMVGLAPTAQGVLRFVGIGHGGASSTSLPLMPGPSLSLWQQLMNRCQYAAKLSGFKTGFSVQEKKAGMLYQIYIDSLRIPNSAQSGGAFKPQSCQDLLFSATALLVSSTDDEQSSKTIGRDRALLAAICRHAVTHHKSDCAAAAVACFDWLLSARPDLSGRLVSSLSAAFQVACVLRHGLFSIDPPPAVDIFALPVPEGQSNCASSSTQDDPVVPHVIILRFLTEKAILAQYAESADAEILCALALRCLRPCVMSKSFSALSAKALLSLVALNLLQSEALVPGFTPLNKTRLAPGSSVIRTALRDRVYATLLDHFAAPLQLMLAIDEKADLRPLLTDLIRLWSTINNEKKFFPSPVRPGSSVPGVIPSVVISGSGSMGNGATSPIPNSASGTMGASSFVNTGGIVRHDAEVSQQRTQNSYFKSRDAASTFSSSSTRRNRLAATTEMNAEAGYVRSWRSKRTLLLLLLAHEIERLQVWYNPTGQANRNVAGWEQIRQFREIIPQTKDKVWRDIVKHAWSVSPAVALSLARRFPIDAIKNELSRFVTAAPLGAVHLPAALPYLASIRNLEADSKQLTYVLHWAQTSPISALAYFSRLYPPHPLTHQYAARVLKTSAPGALILYIPQMVQALRHDPMGYMASVLVWLASHSQLLTHQLIWNMRTNSFRDDSGLQRDGVLGPLVDSLLEAIEKQLAVGNGSDFFKREFEFFKELTDVSGIIRPYPKGPQRKQACLDALRQVRLPTDGAVYLPSNPESLVVDIDYHSGTPMQSAAKAPYLARFSIMSPGLDAVERIGIGLEPLPSDLEIRKQGAIFKVGDDVRQDILALQIIRGLRAAFHAAGLTTVSSGLAPYRVVATAPGSGVIECVPDSQSIDQIGKQTDTSIYEYFLAQYGDEQSSDFQKIRANFIKSMAAYSLISYLLQIKDRHNGNLMIDKSGRIVHIDFGFLFESSPGGNLGFEPDMKLSRELLIVMAGAMPATAAGASSTSGPGPVGGQIAASGASNTWPETAPGFQQFMDLCIRSYLIARQFDEPILTLVSLMLDTGLPCFRGRTIEQLRARLGRQMSEKQAADHMLTTIRYCCQNWRSGAYDWLQYKQNEIQYH